MNKYNIKPPRRKIKPNYTYPSYTYNFTNLINNTNPKSIPPYYIWCSDFTYIPFKNSFLYLATIIDLSTRQLLAFSIAKSHNSSLIINTINKALSLFPKPHIFHSDQGSEFMSSDCISTLQHHNINISVSAKASPWQNGYNESFFARFKLEFGDFNRFDSLSQLLEEIYHHLHYYNNFRIHSALKMPPAVYASKYVESCLPKMGT